VFFRVLLVGFGLFGPGAARAPKKIPPILFIKKPREGLRFYINY